MDVSELPEQAVSPKTFALGSRTTAMSPELKVVSSINSQLSTRNLGKNLNKWQEIGE
jgi:hypothetical protein